MCCRGQPDALDEDLPVIWGHCASGSVPTDEERESVDQLCVTERYNDFLDGLRVGSPIGEFLPGPEKKRTIKKCADTGIVRLKREEVIDYGEGVD